MIEGHLLPDHVHMLTSIPPKYAIAQHMGRKKNFTAGILGPAGNFVSTVGADEETIREYIRRQEQEDRRLDQMSIFEDSHR